jgi:hypothetical protein
MVSKDGRIQSETMNDKVANVHRWLKRAGEIATSVTIITTFVSVVGGVIILRVYLSNFAPTISPLDTLSVVSLQVFMVCFLSFLSSVVCLVLTPFGARYFVDPRTRESLPKLFGSGPEGRRVEARAFQLWEEDGRPEGRDLEHWERAKKLISTENWRAPPLLKLHMLFQFLAEYAMFYLPILLLVIALPVVVYLQLSGSEQNIFYSWFIPLAFSISAALLYIFFRVKGRSAKFDTYGS